VIARALADPDPAARAQFFDKLGLQQADLRPGVGVRDGLPDLRWRRVPSGSFWMGGDPQALGAWPGRSIAMPSDYWTAAYPLTVAQYAAFIREGGHAEAWDAQRISNHPVEVTWYEAYAYAQWLEALRRDGRLVLPPEVPEEHVIRLPDEAEREFAGRYPDGRVYPWGNEYRAGYANIDETSYYERVGPYYLGRVTAVGLYLLGVQPSLGLYDLSGNVSEWCQTMWSGEGYTAENDPRAVGHRVARGGHYRNGANFARAASRTWGDPDPDDQYDPKHGFRLVIGPPLPARSGQAFADALRWRQEHGWAGTTPPPQTSKHSAHPRRPPLCHRTSLVTR